MADPLIIVLEMSYTDAAEDTHAASLWVPASIAIDEIAMQAGITWQGYHDAQAMLDKYQGKPVVPIGQKSYSIGTAQFTVFAGTASSGPLSAALFGACYQEAQTADTPTGATNTDGSQVLASFFAAAAPKYFDLVTGAVTPYPGS